MRGLRPVKIVTVELVRAEDGSTVSSTRIRGGEIDRKGRLLNGI
jgi:pantetheine-phosphate adenylyltransferase